MAEPKEQEPSIEEILESIRQIISEDDKGAEDSSAAASVEAEAEADVEDVADDDVLDLTQKIEEPAAAGGAAITADDIGATFGKEEETQEPEPEPNIDLAEEEVSKSVEDIKPQEPVTPAEPEVPEVTDMPEEPLPDMKPDEPVIAGDTAKLTEEAIARMVTNLAIEREEEMRKRFGQSITLEDIVKELLRPMLRQWVDKNLPRMVERMIEKELEAIVNRTLNG